MGKSKKDACGGHYDRDVTYYGADGVIFMGWTTKFKRWAKHRGNREIRRQEKTITAEAIRQYELDTQDDFYEQMLMDLDDYYSIDYQEWQRELDELEIDERERAEYGYYDDYDYDFRDDYDDYDYHGFRGDWRSSGIPWNDAW